MAISGKAAIAGVIGWPVGHSLSPRLHGYWLDCYGIDGAYIPLAVEPADIIAAIHALAKLGFAGANVTVPHKQAAAAAADRLDDNARRLGAVNTITVGKDGTITGSNTDGFGFMENLRHGAPDWRAEHGPAVVLGAGGAARAVVAALGDAGVAEVRVVNRTFERAEQLADDLGGNISPLAWDALSDALGDAGVLVNTTTLGMAGQARLDIDLAALPVAAVVNDIVYGPLETELLSASRARGNTVVEGIGMLLHQARPGFAAWFGQEPEVTPELRKHIVEALKG